MKQINNTKSEVYLSTYDNSDTLLPVSEEHKNVENICVAVKFGDILIKISQKETCECNWNEVVKNHKDKLIHPAYWQMVGAVYHEVGQALKMLRHEPLRWIWTDTEDNNPQYSGYRAWIFNGPNGYMFADGKYYSFSVRATKVFKIN